MAYFFVNFRFLFVVLALTHFCSYFNEITAKKNDANANVDAAKVISHQAASSDVKEVDSHEADPVIHAAKGVDGVDHDSLTKGHGGHAEKEEVSHSLTNHQAGQAIEKEDVSLGSHETLHEHQEVEKVAPESSKDSVESEGHDEVEHVDEAAPANVDQQLRLPKGNGDDPNRLQVTPGNIDRLQVTVIPNDTKHESVKHLHEEPSGQKNAHVEPNGHKKVAPFPAKNGKKHDTPKAVAKDKVAAKVQVSVISQP